MLTLLIITAATGFLACNVGVWTIVRAGALADRRAQALQHAGEDASQAFASAEVSLVHRTLV